MSIIIPCTISLLNRSHDLLYSKWKIRNRVANETHCCRTTCTFVHRPTHLLSGARFIYLPHYRWMQQHIWFHLRWLLKRHVQIFARRYGPPELGRGNSSQESHSAVGAVRRGFVMCLTSYYVFQMCSARLVSSGMALVSSGMALCRWYHCTSFRKSGLNIRGFKDRIDAVCWPYCWYWSGLFR